RLRERGIEVQGETRRRYCLVEHLTDRRRLQVRRQRERETQTRVCVCEQRIETSRLPEHGHGWSHAHGAPVEPALRKDVEAIGLGIDNSRWFLCAAIRVNRRSKLCTQSLSNRTNHLFSRNGEVAVAPVDDVGPQVAAIFGAD